LSAVQLYMGKYVLEVNFKAEIEMLKQALSEVQKCHPDIFKGEKGGFPGILTQCFFGLKDGYLIFRFFHDSNIPNDIRAECNRAFDEIFSSGKS